MLYEVQAHGVHNRTQFSWYLYACAIDDLIERNIFCAHVVALLVIDPRPTSVTGREGAIACRFSNLETMAMREVGNVRSR